MAIQNFKVVVIGDGAVGKTCLLISYCTNSFPLDYVPTVFDNYSANIHYGDRTLCLGFWDTAGPEDYDRLRPLSYPQTDIFVICFSLANQRSLQNITDKWVPEYRHHCPDVPYVLVGTKVDLIDDPELQLRMQQQGTQHAFADRALAQKIAKETKAYAYVECSAKEDIRVKEVFEKVMQCCTGPDPNQKHLRSKSKKCIMM